MEEKDLGVGISTDCKANSHIFLVEDGVVVVEEGEPQYPQITERSTRDGLELKQASLVLAVDVVFTGQQVLSLIEVEDYIWNIFILAVAAMADDVVVL